LKTTKTHKVNIKAKGKLKVLTFKLHALFLAKSKGVYTSKLIGLGEGKLELEFVGDRKKLWEMVKWSKKGSVRCYVDELQFSFSEVV
jgi:hypothetical protein